MKTLFGEHYPFSDVLVQAIPVNRAVAAYINRQCINSDTRIKQVYPWVWHLVGPCALRAVRGITEVRRYDQHPDSDYRLGVYYYGAERSAGIAIGTQHPAEIEVSDRTVVPFVRRLNTVLQEEGHTLQLPLPPAEYVARDATQSIAAATLRAM